MGFLRTLFIVVLFYYLARFVIRLLAPLFGLQQVYRQANQQPSDRSSRPEGDVRVENLHQQKSKYTRDEGEYTDYEEIK